MGKKGGEQRRKGEGRVEEELGGEGMGRKKVRKTRAVFFFIYTTSNCSCMAGMSSLGSQSLWGQKLLSRSLDVCDVSIAKISHHHICNCDM